MSLSTRTNFPQISPRNHPEPLTRFPEALSKLHFEKRDYPRVAIKVKGSVLFINLGDVVSVQAEGNYVLLQRGSTCYPGIG